MKEQDGTGLIYALSEGTLPRGLRTDEAYFIKIGFTASGSAESRRGGCQTGNPRPLIVVREFPGPQFDENSLHRMLNRYRQVGEWFLLPGEIVRRLRYKRIKSSAELIADLKLRGHSEWNHHSFRDAERQGRLERARAHGEQLLNSRASSIRAAVADLRATTAETLAEVDRTISSANNVTDQSLRDGLLNHYLDIRSDVRRKAGPAA